MSLEIVHAYADWLALGGCVAGALALLLSIISLAKSGKQGPKKAKDAAGNYQKFF